jgi:hypothetical protein
MTLKRYYALVCDSCGKERGGTYGSPSKARASAKRVGWARLAGQYVGDRAGQDLCPKCHNESKPQPAPAAEVN